MEANKKYDKWELEDCANCIVRAEEIKADAEKMKAIKPILEKKMKGYKSAISSLAELKEYAQNKPDDSESEDTEAEVE